MRVTAHVGKTLTAEQSTLVHEVRAAGHTIVLEQASAFAAPGTPDAFIADDPAIREAYEAAGIPEYGAESEPVETPERKRVTVTDA